MLINLTNHPFEKWTDDHKQAAFRQFGIVEDYAFPDIDPNASTDEIKEIASKYISACHAKFQASDGMPDAVHISGEPCFLYQFVALAKEHQINCVCSTTLRLVRNEGNIKTSVFQFVQFRKYY